MVILTALCLNPVFETSCRHWFSGIACTFVERHYVCHCVLMTNEHCSLSVQKRGVCWCGVQMSRVLIMIHVGAVVVPCIIVVLVGVKASHNLFIRCMNQTPVSAPVRRHYIHWLFLHCTFLFALIDS